MQDEKNSRETFASRLGFIFLSAGCAIGLGNVWRFPFITGKFGGAAFVLIYILFLFVFAMPIMVMEFAVGRASKKSMSQSFAVLKPENKIWSLWGYIGWAGNYILMMFYTVVTGWMLAYTFYSFMGNLSGINQEAVGNFFNSLLSSPIEMILWMLLAVIIGFSVCFSGLRGGVEKVTKIMMSGLLIIMITLAIRSVTLDGAEDGLKFYLQPDFKKFAESGTWNVIYAALGQSFFTLSIGIGSMAIFGSYINKDKSLFGESLIITGLDTLVALCAGLIIFPACFAFGINPGAGPGLIFVTLPNMFNFMPAGQIWSTLFFLFMSFAALSTVIAVTENIIAGIMDSLNLSRQRSCVIACLIIFLFSVPCALGFNLWSDVQPLGEGSMILDLEDFIVSNNLLPLGAIIYLLFCTTKYGWGWDNFIKEADTGNGIKFPKFLKLYFKYVIPLIMFFIFAFGYYEKFF